MGLTEHDGYDHFSNNPADLQKFLGAYRTVEPFKVVLYSECHPEIQPGGPKAGDQEWTITAPLSGGGVLELHVGRKGRDALRAMVLHEDLDDAADAAMTTLEA